MRPAGCIRYWTQFPRLIPKCRADHPRVTHPFATRVPRRAFPFDLHVLSTPPAFVLSQNQTLQTKPKRPIREIRSSNKTPKTGIQKHPPLNGKKRRTKTTTNKNHQ